MKTMMHYTFKKLFGITLRLILWVISSRMLLFEKFFLIKDERTFSIFFLLHHKFVLPNAFIPILKTILSRKLFFLYFGFSPYWPQRRLDWSIMLILNIQLYFIRKLSFKTVPRSYVYILEYVNMRETLVLLIYDLCKRWIDFLW